MDNLVRIKMNAQTRKKLMKMNFEQMVEDIIAMYGKEEALKLFKTSLTLKGLSVKEHKLEVVKKDKDIV